MEKNKEGFLDKIPLYSKELFFFFLIVSGNYIAEIFSCNIQKKFSQDRITKHFLGLMTIYFFVTYVDEDKFRKPIWAFLTAFALYIWFIMISLTAHKYTLIIISIIFFIYVSNNIFNYYANENKNDNQELEKIKKNKQIFQLVLFIIAIIMTIYGFLVYLGQKKTEYGKNFNFKTFFMGTSQCKFNGLGKKKVLDDAFYIKTVLN